MGVFCQGNTTHNIVRCNGNGNNNTTLQLRSCEGRVKGQCTMGGQGEGAEGVETRPPKGLYADSPTTRPKKYVRGTTGKAQRESIRNSREMAMKSNECRRAHATARDGLRGITATGLRGGQSKVTHRKLRRVALCFTNRIKSCPSV